MVEIDRSGRISRRAALRASGGGMAAAFALRARSAALAQDATPAGMAPDIVQDWIAAWNSDDPVTNVAALYTADGLYEDVPTGMTSANTGTDVAGFVRAFVQAISNIDVQLRSGFGSDGWAAAEWTFSFDYTGQLPGLPPGSGQHIVWPGATIFELKGDKIQRSADYYDNTGFLAALGLLAAPAATPAP
jgi:steroid delta-isomerase-like uncharacterized protein